jgi:hypothetical protein
MTLAFAAQVVTWRYPPPYDTYDMVDTDLDFLVDSTSGFHALVEGDELIGFRSFGDDGQVPGARTRAPPRLAAPCWTRVEVCALTSRAEDWVAGRSRPACCSDWTRTDPTCSG